MMPDALISALNELLSAVKELLTLSYEKRRAITRGDTERLSEISERETRLITSVNAAERRREAAMPEAARALGLTGEATLNDAADAAAGETRAELKRLKQELTTSMRLLLEMNERSRIMLEDRLRHTADCIDALTLPELPFDIYTGDGRLFDKSGRGYYIGDA